MPRRSYRPEELAQPDGSLPRNFLRPCILLLLKEGSSHGYDLLEKLGEFGFHRGDPGGLYRTLRSMEKEGLVSSWWETSDIGPARRTYQPTEEGEDWLHAWAGALSESKRLVSTFLDRYDKAAAVGRMDRAAGR